MSRCGSVDRRFIAYDQATGKELWHKAVGDTPNGAPISYAVEGRQYVAMVTGHGNPLSSGVGALTHRARRLRASLQPV